MFAVIKTGGKQYKVSGGEVLKLEKLEGKAGDKVTFGEVLATDKELDAKKASATKVIGEILEQKKDDKIIVFKKKRRHNYRRKIGHRQQVSMVRIIQIGEEKFAAPKKAEVKEDKKPAAKKEAKPAAKKPAAKKAPAKKTAAKKDEK